MLYLRDVRNSILIAHDQGLVSDEELMLLLKATSSKNQEFSYEKYARSVSRVLRSPSACPSLELKKTFHCLLMHFDYRTLSTAIREPLLTKPSNRTRGNLGQTDSKYKIHFILLHGIFYGENNFDKSALFKYN